MLASTSGGGELGLAWANMTPDTAGGCPPAIPAGEPTITSQPLNSPATTDRLLFRDIVSKPSRCP
jgi:hypothetical protein